MDITKNCKVMGIVLAFSIMLNVGFLTTVFLSTKGDPWLPPPRPQVMKKIRLAVLDDMGLSEDLKHKMAAAMDKLEKDHRDIMQRVSAGERQIIERMGVPGPLAPEAVEALVLENHRSVKEINLKKIHHMMEIRALLGPEKTADFYSRLHRKIKSDFQKKKGEI